MLKVNDTDSFGVELSKNFAQSIIGSVVAMTGMIGGLAIVGAVLGKTKLKVVHNDEIVVLKKDIKD